MTVEELQDGLKRHDDGVLKYGCHKAGSREFCALEFSSIMRGKPFSDQADDLPDIRVLNDAFGRSKEADIARTAHVLPVMAVLWDWASWSVARKQGFSQLLAVKMVNRLIVALPGLPDDIVEQCRKASTCNAAARAAVAARAAGAAPEAAHAMYSAARAAAWAEHEDTAAAATAAAWAAADAARAAGAAGARVPILAIACHLWVEAAEESLLGDEVADEQDQ